jgi:hypothetical protein
VWVLSNAPGRPHSLDLYREIQVVYASKYLLRYSAYGSVSHSYLQAVLYEANNQPATDKKGGPTLKEFWKGYNIWNAVNNTGDSWAEIKESTMNG